MTGPLELLPFQAEIQESNLDSSNVCMASLEREMRSLVKEVEALREAAERVKSLEGDNRELCKQAAIDQRTLVTLREVKRTNHFLLTSWVQGGKNKSESSVSVSRS